MIEISHLTKRYGSKVAIEDISFSVPDGTVYGLVGHNGAGKTTLLKTAAGVYLPTSGSILIDGRRVGERHGDIPAPFIVADEPYFVAGATLERMRDFYAGYYPSWSDETFSNLVGLSGLDSRSRIAGYSKGMQRQAAILLGLSTGARTVLMDESFDGLDMPKRTLLKRLLHRYAQVRNAAVILSSHNLRELEGIADRLGMIEEARLVFDEAVEALHERYKRCDASFAGDELPAGLQEMLGQEVVIRWMRSEHRVDGRKASGQAHATLVFEGDASKVEAVLASQGAAAIEISPSSLEEVFLTAEEVTDDDIEGVFA